jgi:putative ABC transport system permease protein
MTQLKIAVKGLLNSKKFSLLFILNLSIGLFGFIALDSLKRSFNDVLDRSSKNLLTADLVVSSRREMTRQEEDIISSQVGDNSEIQNSLRLYSMVLSPSNDRSQLVEVKAIEKSYPFYGGLKLKQGGLVKSNSEKSIITKPHVWLSPDLMGSLDVKLGGTIRLGEKSFTVTDIIEDDNSSSFFGASMAPRMYVGIDQMKDTGLLKEGSTVWRSKLIKLNESMSPDDMESLLYKALESPTIKVASHNSANEQNGRILAYLSDYLGIVSLVAFFLSGLGSIYLFRGYLIAKHREIAVLVSLGLSHGKAILIYTYQIIILGTIGALFSSLLVLALLPGSESLIKTFTPIEFIPIFALPTFLVALAMGILGTLTLCLPLLPYIKNLSPGQLFQESYEPQLHTSKTSLLLTMPAISCFLGLSIWQANSFFVGILFFCAVLTASLLLIFIALALIFFIAKAKPSRLSSKLAFNYLTKQRLHTISSFLALSIGALLINLIPQLRHSILSEIERPGGDGGLQLPSLFIFDIQEDQVDELRALSKKNEIELQTLSPLVRARLVSINGKPFTKGSNEKQFSREEQVEQRFRNRGVNLSYRSNLSPSESIVEGKAFSGSYDWEKDEPAEISVEKRYAERLGLSIGDTLAFNVQGMTIDARVVNLRKVKWNSFQPNFFIQFQDGVLEDAPKSFIASFPTLTSSEKLNIQNKIVRSFPNISIIDVTGLVEKISGTINQMSLILSVMAWITLFAGLVVIFSIASHQIQQRLWDINMLKILGASYKDMFSLLAKEFGFLAIASGIFGGMFGLVVSFLIAHFVFEGIWRPDLFIPLASLIAIVVICVLVARLAAGRILSAKAALALKRND